MNITTEQLAELLAGIARSQQAVIDAVDRAQPGFRGTYLLPTLNVAANLRIPEVRLLDLPSRILLRSQGRVPMDIETVVANLNAALGQAAAVSPVAAPKASAAASAAVPASPVVGNDAESDFFNS